MSTARAPSARAFTTSVPRRTPPSTRTSARPPTASTTAGRASRELSSSIGRRYVNPGPPAGLGHVPRKWPRMNREPQQFEVVFQTPPSTEGIVLQFAADANEAATAFPNALRRLRIQGATGGGSHLLVSPGSDLADRRQEGPG